jgi:hypothetical protein
MAGRNDPKGKAYIKAFSQWLDERKWARDLDKATRNHALWCADHHADIEEWRETLAPNVQQKLNHPSTMKRHYEAEHKVTGGKAAAAEKLTPMEKLKQSIVELQAENDVLKKKVRRADDAEAMFDWNRDEPGDIATVLERLYPTKSRAVASEIMRRQRSSRLTRRLCRLLGLRGLGLCARLLGLALARQDLRVECSPERYMETGPQRH